MLHLSCLRIALALFSLPIQLVSGFHAEGVIDSARYSSGATSLTTRHATKSDSNDAKLKLNVGIVGAGPSGLLLAHGLLKGGHKVSIVEARSDPRTADIEGRAYALGLGIRGRSAIKSLDEGLWQAVKSRGFESERFDLRINSLIKIRLRDEQKNSNVEPSLLLYQTDLCAALLDELESQYGDKSICDIKFDTRVTDIQSIEGAGGKLVLQEKGSTKTTSKFDLIAGCDGVNSAVREGMAKHQSFEQQVDTLPGEFKVCRSKSMPPKLDPTAVALLLPKSGAVTAFVEPTRNHEACILFAGRDSSDPILSDSGELNRKDLLDRYPLLEGMDSNAMDDMVSQLKSVKPSRASSVQCNIYHNEDNMVLCGDAAHATGGVSGQGVNSALIDSAVLTKCLSQYASVREALLAYSQCQVPEGKALYDLSFGPSGVPSPFMRIKSLLVTARDTIFQGKLGIGRPPLQTLLTTSLVPFADIRRNRESYFSGQPFPSAETWNKTIAGIYS